MNVLTVLTINFRVSASCKSLFLTPAAWKSFFHSGGMFRMSNPLSRSHPIWDSCLNPVGPPMTISVLDGLLFLNFEKSPPFFLAGFDFFFPTEGEAAGLLEGAETGAAAATGAGVGAGAGAGSSGGGEGW